jgi:putative salt-induced outer membrane protein YdiY
MKHYSRVLVAAAAGLVADAGVFAASQIKLSSGETLVVELVEVTAETVRFVHPVLGEVSVPASKVTILPDAVEAGTPSPGAPAVTPAPPMTPPPPPPAPLPAEPPRQKEWKFKLVIGGALTEGNSQAASFNSVFTAVRETQRHKTALDAGYFFTSSDGDRSENRLTTGGRHDWLNPGSKWFYFADARYDLDEFQSWDHRVNGHVGLGYKLIEPPPFKFNALAGIGAVKEWGSDNEDVRPEALFGIEGEYTFAEKHSLVFSSTVFPDLLELGEFRWVNAAGWTFLLDKETRLSLNAGVQHEYQSQVDEGREHNDLRVTAGLGLEF